ncbi:MAG: hypothetical protein COT16_03600 [Elusimicrobia bacterium CG08_land_8_20_14_0_20_44_26]|nr:MAG: hypothetical protein COT16_03600 [Elusimicrobia bacterium CG08_land_8_20_14_0_20_44_26]
MENKGMKKNILFFFLALGFVFSLYILSQRVTLEKTLKAVEIACDFNDVRFLAEISGGSITEVLKDLKSVGITTVGVTESTVKHLAELGIITLTDGREMDKWLYVFGQSPKFLEAKQIANRDDFIYVFTKNPALGKFIKTALLKKLDEASVIGTFTGQYYMVIASGKKMASENIHLGFWQSEIDTLKYAGLRYILRPSDDALISEKWLDGLFEGFETDSDLSGILVEGFRVPGDPKVFAKNLKKLDIPFGSTEFTKISGADEVVKELGKTFLCYSPKGENDREAIETVVRSVKERNVQLIYLHPKGESYPKFISFLARIKSALEENSFTIGRFKPLPLWGGNYWAFSLIGTAILLAAGWLLTIIYKVSPQFELAYAVIALASPIFLVKFTGFRMFLAFIGTITFPVLAISKTWKRLKLPPLFLAVWLFIQISGLSCLGGIFVAAILSSTDFMLKINIFRGVKLSLLAPMAIAFVLLYGREKSYFTTSLTRLWRKRLEVKHLFIGIVIGGSLMLLVLRSSNYLNFMLPFESEARNILEKLFYIRPRFKEFLLGHPLMLIGLYLYPLAAKVKKIQFRPFIILGLIGQVSILNTFAHIHSPVTICLFRTFNGLILGIIIGAIVIKLMQALKIISAP